MPARMPVNSYTRQLAFINYLFFVKGAAMLCLLLQRRLAKLDENGEQGKGKELSSQFIFLISERTDR